MITVTIASSASSTAFISADVVTKAAEAAGNVGNSGDYGLPEGVELSTTLIIFGVIFVVTFLLRALPFAALSFFRRSPLVAWLGLGMPIGVMTTLVIYTIYGSKDMPGGLLPVFLALAVTLALHIWRRSAPLSIIAGTVFYMILVNIFF